MNLLEFEEIYAQEGCTAICGVDEAGRGPLAGPVCAAAVILYPGQQLPGVQDSKTLSEKRREALFDEIVTQVRGYGIGYASEGEIDAHNILRATFLAMARAVQALPIAPDVILVDGNQDPGFGTPTLTIVKGDSRSLSIAAASILAKVSRDRLMADLDKQYPEYQFAKHKGYPTKLHYELVAAHGLSPVHRRSFFKKQGLWP